MGRKLTAAQKRSLAAKKGWKTRRRKAREAGFRERGYERAERRAIQEEPTVRKGRRWNEHVPIQGWEKAEDPRYRFRKWSRDNSYPQVDPDYMTDLAEAIDVDVSDLYDMYYGYAPGSSES